MTHIKVCLCVCEIEGSIKVFVCVREKLQVILSCAYFRFAKSQTKLGRMTKSKSG